MSIRSTSTFFLLLLCASGFASDYVVELPKDSAAIQGLDFYIDKVWDIRVDKFKAGTARTGFLNLPNKAVFRKPVSEALQEYFDRVAPKTDGKRPVSVEVQEFEVDEQLGFPTESATAQVRLAFKARNGLIYSTFSQMRRSSAWDVTEFHGGNLAACLNMALRKLSSMDTVQTSITSSPPSSSTKYPLTEQFALAKADASALPGLPPPERSAVLVSWIPGWKANGIGIQWLKYQEDSDHWTYPSLASLEVPVIRRGGVKSVGFLEYTNSIAGLRRISSGPFSVLLQLGLPVGFESFDEADGTHKSGFFIGLNSSQCIAFLPVRKSGVAFDAGPFESVLLGSELYPYDLGFRMGLGVQF